MRTTDRPAHGRPDELVTEFDDQTLRTLDRLARRDGRSRADILQAAVREYIAKNALPEDDEPTPPPKGG